MTTVSHNVHRQIAVKYEAFLHRHGLACLFLPFPLKGVSGRNVIRGIQKRLHRNRSTVVTEDNTHACICETEHTVSECASVKTIKEDCNSLSDKEAKRGFVMILAEKEDVPPNLRHNAGEGQPQYRTIAGGVVKVIDDNEREVVCVWCRRSLANEDADKLMQIVVLRLFSEAFCVTDGLTAANRPSPNILVSIPERCMHAFPIVCQEYLQSPHGLHCMLHCETDTPHHDHNKCRCLKNREATDCVNFYAISQRRFFSRFNTAPIWLDVFDMTLQNLIRSESAPTGRPTNTRSSVAKEFENERTKEAQADTHTHEPDGSQRSTHSADDTVSPIHRKRRSDAAEYSNSDNRKKSRRESTTLLSHKSAKK